jgi:hypothetical protein
MDSHLSTEFFFDPTESDTFNDFVHSNNEGISDLISENANTHNGSDIQAPGSMNKNTTNSNLHNTMDLNMNLNNLSNMQNLSHLGKHEELSFQNNNSDTNNNNSENRDIGEGINMKVENNAMNINDINMETLNYLDNTIDKNTSLSNSGSDNEVPIPTTSGSISGPSYRPKSSPKKSFDKRRSSLTLDETANSQKRTRASGEILDYLMNEFLKNSNPTTLMRKEISSKTGMPERSVRIWFQNRRAKARKMEKLNQKDSNNPDSNNNDIQDINELDKENTLINDINNNEDDRNTKDLELNLTKNNMKNALSKMNTLPIEINGKYHLIECKSLSVGNWQRIRSGYVKSESLKKLNNLSPRLLSEIMSTTDLLVILSKKDQELNYFFSGVFQNEKVLFRIFYPIVNILKCSLLNQTQSMNNVENYNNDYTETLLQVELGASPQFAVFFSRDPSTGEENANQWSICEDFSEGQQVATAYIGEGGTNLPHILSDDLGRLKYLSTLISSLNKLETTSNSSSNNNNNGNNLSVSKLDPQIRSTQNQFSPLNQTSTNNSTPASINMIQNYAGFPQHSSYSLNMNEDDIMPNDLLYNLDNGSMASGDSNQQQIQRQFQQQQQQQQHHQHHQQQQHQEKQKHQALTPTSMQQQGPQQIYYQKKNGPQGNKSLYNGSILSNSIAMEGMFNAGTAVSDAGDSKLGSSDLDLFRQTNHEDVVNDNETDNGSGNLNMGMNMPMNMNVNMGMGMNMPMSIGMPMNMNMPMNMPMNMNMNMGLMNMDITSNANASESNLLNNTEDNSDLIKTTDTNKDNGGNDDDSFFLGF